MHRGENLALRRPSPDSGILVNGQQNEQQPSDQNSFCLHGKCLLSDSAGTSDAHEGEPCDARAVLTCRRRDVQLAGHRARQIEASDFEKFDLILAMDWEVLTELQQRAPAAMRHKIQLLMRYANDIDEAIVPDPYYGLNEGFTRVYEYCSDACEGIIENFEKKAKQLLAARASVVAAEAKLS